MAAYLGLKALRRLCEMQDVKEWFAVKLGPQLFHSDEKPVFEWIEDHLKNHHVLPALDTVAMYFPQIKDVPSLPEPPSYYVQILENEYYRRLINEGNLRSQKILNENQNNWREARDVLLGVTRDIAVQSYRQKIVSTVKDAKSLILQNYHGTAPVGNVSFFGWPYMDIQGGAMPGDVVSFIGRPQTGKSWLSLYTASHNWLMQKYGVLFVSMEMAPLPILQRLTTMIAGTNLTQLKNGGYSTETYKKFVDSLNGISLLDESQNMWVVDGNLAADMEDIYQLADQLKVKSVVIDGAYLCRHKNLRLDRFTRAAENCELSKQYTSELKIATFSSWQFNRQAVKGKGKGEGQQQAGLEDIGYSDAIGQISSIVLGLFQEDGVETVIRKTLRVLKGRSGEVGEFDINWDFDAMNFDQADIEDQGMEKEYI